MNIDNFNLNQSFGFLINALSLNIKHQMDIRLKPYDLTVHQFGILLNIYKKGPLTQKEIAQQTSGDEPTTTRLMKRLEIKGYIKRLTDQGDKRKKLVSLSQAGIALLQKILPNAQAVNQQITNDLSEDEKRILLTLLNRVLKSATN